MRGMMVDEGKNKQHTELLEGTYLEVCIECFHTKRHSTVCCSSETLMFYFTADENFSIVHNPSYNECCLLRCSFFNSRLVTTAVAPYPNLIDYSEWKTELEN